jgi:site-specific DNA recombinase
VRRPDNYRHVGGRVCNSRPVHADELDTLVWEGVRRLLEDPALVRAEIDRRLKTLRTEHPATRRREALERDLTRAAGAIERLIEAYQEQLISPEELRARMPALRKRQSTLQAQLETLDGELHDAETYLKLADTLESFLARLNDGLDQLSLDEQQRILRLVVREVLIGGEDDKITIPHSIPHPKRRARRKLPHCVGAVRSGDAGARAGELVDARSPPKLRANRRIRRRRPNEAKLCAGRRG